MGGKVFDRERQIILVDGMFLPKAAAYVMWKLKGRRYRVPKTNLEKILERLLLVKAWV